MEFSDTRWKKLNGGYRIPYDASLNLTRLQDTNDKNTISEVLDELWENLHHQGDVDLASYLAVPHLINIAVEKNIFSWKLLSLCNTIEQQRQDLVNPKLPEEFKAFYLIGLTNLKSFALGHLNKELSQIDLITALSTVATCNGQFKIGKAIMEMEDEDLINEFLQQF